MRKNTIVIVIIFHILYFSLIIHDSCGFFFFFWYRSFPLKFLYYVSSFIHHICFLLIIFLIFLLVRSWVELKFPNIFYESKTKRIKAKKTNKKKVVGVEKIIKVIFEVGQIIHSKSLIFNFYIWVIWVIKCAEYISICKLPLPL